jgi:hypothetical protein
MINQFYLQERKKTSAWLFNRNESPVSRRGILSIFKTLSITYFKYNLKAVEA